MKHLCLSLLAGSFILATSNAAAQSAQGAMRVGGQVGYGTQIETVGIGGRFDYALTEVILLAPDLMYFFSQSESDFDWSWFDINLNGNYLFEVNNGNVIPYVLAGVNIALLSFESDTFSEFDETETEVGINLGGGADFKVGNLFIFGEVRFATTSDDQVVIAGGVKVPLN